VLGRADESVKPVLQEKLPLAAIADLPLARDAAQARKAIAAFFAGG